MQTNLVSTVYQAAEILGITKLIGYSVTGSSLLNVKDSQSDLDVVLITLGENTTSKSNILNFYSPVTGELVEFLVEDILELQSIEDCYGYQSWINYLVPKRKPKFINELLELKYKIYQQLMLCYRPFWIHGMLKGYSSDLKSLQLLLIEKNLATATKSELKELYHLGVTYNEDFIWDAKPELIKKIKRKNLTHLTAEDYTWLLKVLKNRIDSYLIKNSKDEAELFKTFKEQLDLIWK